jgi:hypothetical protein
MHFLRSVLQNSLSPNKPSRRSTGMFDINFFFVNNRALYNEFEFGLEYFCFQRGFGFDSIDHRIDMIVQN